MKPSVKDSVFTCFIGVLLIAVFGFQLTYLENMYMYHPHIPGETDGEPLSHLTYKPLIKKLDDVYFHTEDGVRLNAWYFPGESDKSTIVFAHGNGGHIGIRENTIRTFVDNGYGLFAFDYRGYGNSHGSPSEEGLYLDMKAASHHVAKEYGIPSSRQIAMGESLGSGVVIEVARYIPFRAVFVYAGYTSMPEVCAHLRQSGELGFLNPFPMENFMQQRYDSISKIQDIKSPILVAHGVNDTFIPIRMSEALFQQARAQHKKYLPIPKAGHSDLFLVAPDQIMETLELLLQESKEKTE
jgi:uncharacterized protein